MTNQPTRRFLVTGESHLTERLGNLFSDTQIEAHFLPFTVISEQMLRAWDNRVLPIQKIDDPQLFRQLDLSEYDSVLLLSDHDDSNLQLALQIRDNNPTVNLIISFLNYRLGRKVEKELKHCTVLSIAEISAPQFAAAAIANDIQGTITIDKMQWSIRKTRSEINNESLSLVMANELFQTRTDQLLAQKEPHSPLLKRPDRLLLGIMVLTGILFISASTYFHFSQNISWMSSFYFVITTLCTVGYGDFSLKDASDTAKVVGMFLMISSVTLTACLFAIITNTLIQKRTDIHEGRTQCKFREHFIICGAGRVGILTAKCFHRMGRKVIVIEKNSSAPLLDELRELKIPFMIADASRAGVLTKAGINRAQAVLSLINGDMNNLELGLAARAIRSDIHLVVRIFDAVLADRMQRHFHINTALSASSEAAPVFLAAALSPKALTIIELDKTYYAVMKRSECSEENENQFHIIGDAILVPLDQIQYM